MLYPKFNNKLYVSNDRETKRETKILFLHFSINKKLSTYLVLKFEKK